MFELIKGDEGPRLGKLTLPSGTVVRTPLFMPVATKLSVKAIDPIQLALTGTEAIITNGFLSHLEPGSAVLKDAGGIGRFMGWGGGVFSDSGGFQFIRKGFDAVVNDKEVRLRSPFSGEKVAITPESVVDFHCMHGVDVGMVLDHCPPFSSTAEQIMDSARRTVLWARRSMERIRSLPEGTCPDGKEKPMIFGITQGGTDPSQRSECTSDLVRLGMDGYGIGGLSIGEDKEDTFRSLAASTSLLPIDKPRYFMGVGEPSDLIRSVSLGVDIFDSVFPTRNARHRSLFTRQGRENVRGPAWKGNSLPIMERCDCMTCKKFSRGYIHHLFKAEEPLAATLSTIHNIRYMQLLIMGIRAMISEGPFSGSTSVNDVLDVALSEQ
jgi:queuine tRNA-ribosyltransferase